MIKLLCIIKPECDACNVAIKNINFAITDINFNIIINIKNTTDDIIKKYNIKSYPTIIFFDYNENNTTEIARLEGSFPKDYIYNIMNKLNN